MLSPVSYTCLASLLLFCKPVVNFSEAGPQVSQQEHRRPEVNPRLHRSRLPRMEAARNANTFTYTNTNGETPSASTPADRTMRVAAGQATYEHMHSHATANDRQDEPTRLHQMSYRQGQGPEPVSGASRNAVSKAPGYVAPTDDWPGFPRPQGRLTPTTIPLQQRSVSR